MAKPLIPFIVALILFFSSCSIMRDLSNPRSAKNTAQQPIALSEVKVTQRRTDVIRVDRPKVIDILHTNLAVSFNWGKHECIGRIDIRLKPYFYETDSIVLDAKHMTFNEISLKTLDGEQVLFTTDYDKKFLRLKLERKLTTSDTVTLSLKYIARPDESLSQGGTAIRDDKGLYFVNTDHSEPNKPMQLWTQGEPESNSNWFPTIDKPNEKFTMTLAITVNKEMTTLSNGILVSSTINGLQKTDVWESRKQMPAYLVMMAVGNFIKTTDELSTLIKDSFVAYTYDTFRVETLIDSVLVLKDSIVSHPVTKYRLVKQDMLNGVEVSYYLEPSYSPFAQQIFKHTPEMIDFFGAKLGVSYPWEKYAQVVVHDFVSGAMENTSATVHNESIQKYPRELLDASNDDIIAHELFHQWFGDLVTCASWTHLVLNEGFATYGEQLWHEFKYGKDAAQLKWYNALNRYLKFAEDKHDDPIVQLNYLQPDDLFNAITYQKGSLVLHLLRSELGDEAFFTGLRQYLTEFSLANAEIEDLRKVFEKVSGKDLRPFFAQWFLRGGHPELEIRYSFIDSTKLVSLTIEQKQSAQTGLFQFPLHFKVIHGQKQKAYTFDINRKTETFFVSKLDPEESSYPTIVVDPDGLFIGEINDNKPLIDHIRSYYHASGYIEKLRALTALSAIQQTTDTARLVLLAALNDADANIRVKAMDIIKWDDSRNRFVARNILVQMAESDASVKVRAKSVLVLSEWKDNNLLAFFRTKCLDSSYTIAAHALEGLYKINETEALGMASILEKSARRDLFRKVAELYSKSGNLTDESFFSSSMMTQFGRNRIALINEYSDFCTRLRDTLLYEKAISVLNERAYNDKQPMVRAAAVVGLNNILQQQLNDVPTIKNAGQKAALQASAASLKESLQRIVDQELSKQAIEFLKTRGILQTPVNGVE